MDGEAPMIEEIINAPCEVKNGSVLENDHGYPVGHCVECRFGQRKMYALDGKWYCLTCFPKMVDLKNALKKLIPQKKWESGDAWKMFDIVQGASCWPSDNPKDTPYDKFTCKKCGYEMTLLTAGSQYIGERSFLDKAADRLIEHLNAKHPFDE